jgi:flagellar basal-body rod modification protein FlgD
MTISVASTTAAGSPVAGMTVDDFLKILSAQLTSQDPLKPVDDQQFVAQIAQFTTLEQSRQLNAKFDSLLSLQSVSQSVGLLGRTVDVNLGDGLQTGRITALALTNDTPQLSVTLNSGAVRSDLTLSNIVNIR